MIPIARIYGSSLFELAQEEQCTEAVKNQILWLGPLLREYPAYVKLISEPSLDRSERNRCLDEAFGSRIEPMLGNLVKIFCDKNLMHQFEDCCEAFLQCYQKENNIAAAAVTSAVALSPEQTEALIQKLEQMSKKTVWLMQRIDPEVLGGLKVEIEGKQIDGTLQGRLETIARCLEQKHL